ncbi:MAG: histidine kinase dimerization/phospho-acceptor domain-containing protein, partial [bacterium]|nr:histidine kinase dimerization/phospho-acceptor domain-containing protein [bacterium]
MKENDVIAKSEISGETVLKKPVLTKYPFSLKIAILISLLGILAFSALSYTVANRQMMKNLNIKVDTTLMTLATENTKEIAGFFSQAEEDLKLLASPANFGRIGMRLQEIEQNFLLLSRNNHYIGYIDEQGREQVKILNGRPSRDYRTVDALPGFEEIMASPGTLSPFDLRFVKTVNPIHGSMLFIPEVLRAISVPDKSSGGAAGSILTISRTHQFCRSLEELKVSSNGLAMILDKTGRVVYHPDVEFIGQDFRRFPWVREMLWIKGDWHWLEINNNKYRAAVAELKRLNWLVVIMAPWNDFTGEIRIIQNAATTIAAAILLVALFVGYYIFSQMIRQRQKDFEQQAKVAVAERTMEHNIELSEANTKLEEAAGLIEEERDKAESLIRSITECLVVVGPDGLINYINAAAEKIFRVKRSEVEGRTVGSAFRHQELSRLVEKVQEQGKDILAEDVTIMETVGYRTVTTHLKVSVGALKGEVDEVHGCVIVLRDVTRERELDRLKSEFLSAVSHELRTPLTSIKGTLELLAGGVLGDTTDEQDKFLTVTRGECDRLIRLINDLLDLSQIESKRLQLQFRL